VYPGIVDMNKFNDNTLDTNINYPTKRHATASLTLINNQDGKVRAQAYLNKQQYENLETLINSKASGQGSAMSYTKDYPVTYELNGAYYYGTIIMEIVIPNS
jgi:hypothetical protein